MRSVLRLKAAITCWNEPSERLSWQVLSERNGLSSDNIQSLISDRYGFLWVATDGGLSRVDPSNNYVRRYSPSNDVLSNAFTGNCALQISPVVLITHLKLEKTSLIRMSWTKSVLVTKA